MFGGIGSIMLKNPLPLQELLKQGILDPRSGYNPDEHFCVDVDGLAASFSKILDDKAEMFHEYFMLGISKGMLLSLPNALGVTSESGLNFEGLPLFLVRLSVEPNWAEEKECLGGICRIIADFCVEALMPSEDKTAQTDTQLEDNLGTVAAMLNAAVEAGEFEDVVSAAAARRKRPRTSGPQVMQELRWVHEAIRRDGECKWPAAFARDGTVLDLVSLDQLYRIFERC